ncbi:MAG: HAMP domain-containing histidine kinase [Salinivirgaceae bacterium]|nr:HAMP domain-containing histidine kinase [Salinivirgaceae bacterium]
MLEKLAEFPENYDEQKRQKLLLKLSETAKSTFDLLENLLNWSKSQTGIISFEPTNLKVTDIIQELVKFAQPIADKKHICISSIVKPTVTVFADSNMLKTIFRNLLTNAIKFTPENGYIQIFSNPKGDFVEFGIKDNGMGISKEIKNSLFLNPGIYSSLGTQQEKGSGLGLLLCKDFTEINGGQIRVESEVEIGSIFYFTLKTKL